MPPVPPQLGLWPEYLSDGTSESYASLALAPRISDIEATIGLPSS